MKKIKTKIFYVHIRTQENNVLCQQDKKQQIVACYTNKLRKIYHYHLTMRKPIKVRRMAKTNKHCEIRCLWSQLQLNTWHLVKLKAVYPLDIDAT
jgi:hypothetical protein